MPAAVRGSVQYLFLVEAAGFPQPYRESRGSIGELEPGS